jgi:hypothetical protein
MRFLLEDTDINCTSNTVHMYNSSYQPLLQALVVVQHNNNMFQLIAYIVWCSSCGQNLTQFATHCFLCFPAKCCFINRLFYDFCQTCPISQLMHGHDTAVDIDFVVYYRV